ncbi:glycoside hydrolase superfamily [Amylocarpus encephaloides]|uniref:alpha-galactosidase n=1 Tax=Amylocarpus encephaloides TaxID=45428 RepID=A0A9P7YQ85_9HELO|nr:glycoside hydrolase superfamily [Amylocarpus encephaloides]
MRFSPIVVLGVCYVQAISAAAIPRNGHSVDWFSWVTSKGWKYEAKNGRWRWKHHHKGHNSTTVSNYTRPAGAGQTLTIAPPFEIPGAEPTTVSGVSGNTALPPVLTSCVSLPTAAPLEGGIDDEEDDDDEEATLTQGGPTTYPTLTSKGGFTYPGSAGTGTGTAPTSSPTIIDDSELTTQVAPDTTYTASSPPIIATEGGDQSSESSIVQIQTQTVIPLPATTAVPTTSAPVTTAPAAGPYWKPTAGLSWQIQLAGKVTDLNLPVDVYDIDLIESTSEMITTLHTNNKKVICYFSAGSFESWRPDAASFQAGDKGSPLEGWDNEWWLNTNSANVRTIMKARLDLARSKGCDAVDPDNVDVYHNANGVGITEANSIDYLNFLSTEAHSRGMAMGLKNAVELTNTLLGAMDFEVNESCMEFNECSKLAPFIAANKAVFHIEYNNAGSKKRAKAAAELSCSFKGGDAFSSLLKNPNLDAFAQACTGVLAT